MNRIFFNQLNFLIDKFDMLHFVKSRCIALNLRCMAHYFGTSIYCNIIAIESIFITLYHYSTILLSILISSPRLIYY